MATVINASTTSGAVISPDTSGILNLQSNGTTVASVSSTGVAVTGNITASGATGGIGYGPAFSAYGSAGQSISNITFTKVQINTETFDTANCFDPITNYRFTPNVAGYYQINGCVNGTSSLVIRTVRTYIYKNGTAYKLGGYADVGTGATATTSLGSSVGDLVYMNGTTDYVELYVWMQLNSGTLNTSSGASMVYFSGFLARSA